MTTLKNFARGIRGAKQVAEEAQGLAPIIRNFLGNMNGGEAVKNATNKQIYDAINFAVQRIQNDPHTILGVDKDDPPEMIQEVYRVKAKRFHPDGKSPDAEKFRKVDKAYRELING